MLKFSGSTMLDRVGGCVSTACAIHCAMKTLLFILPSMAWFEVFLTEQFEGYMIGTGVLLSLTSVSWGYCRHQKIYVWIPLILSLGLLFWGRVIVPHAWELYFVIPGGLGVAGTHWINLQANRSCDICDH